MALQTIYESQCKLGESPYWHAARKSCFWVDIDSGILYEYSWPGGKTQTWKFEGKLTFVTAAHGNSMIIALDAKIARLNLATGQYEMLAEVEDPVKNSRCNDGRCDSSGRLWIGTLHLEQRKEAGALYCIDDSLIVRKRLEGVTISNGMAWSADDQRMYFIDSPTQVVRSFAFDKRTGEIFFEKEVIHVPVALGSPDGMAIDDEGMLWIAHYNGFGVYRWDPATGKILDKIEVPVPQVTSCAFVGENLDHLLITTARENMEKDEIKKFPASGNAFAFKMKVKGMRGNICLI